MKKQGMLLISALMLTLLITFFIRTVRLSNPHVDIHDIEMLKLQKNELIINNNQIKQQINDVDVAIKTISATSNNANAIADLQKSLVDLERLSGKMAVCGEGIIITIDDSKRPLGQYQEPEDFIVHDVNLRVLVDELWRAGAEAISINGTRIIFGLSRINCSGPTININEVEHGSPYIIRAIGDRYELQRKMTEDGSYANTLERFALNIEVNTKVYLKIEGYQGQLIQSYAKAVEK